MEFSDSERKWRAFQNQLSELDLNAKKWKDSLNKNYKDLDSHILKLKAQEKELHQLSSILPSSFKPEIVQSKQTIEKLRFLFTSGETGSLFVRLILGQVNVKQFRSEERLRLKEEYQKFKRRTDPLFLSFVIVQLFVLRNNRAIEILFQIWLLYYYVTLALRENILKVNGSNIKQWWIYHHYISIAISLTILTWSTESITYAHFLSQFLYFSLFQGCVQILQNKYQTSKLYKMIAMGKADTMDVTGEGLLTLEKTSSWLSLSPSINVLLPFLLFVQAFQIYNGITCLHLGYSHFEDVEWEVFACGILFLALGIGNLIATLDTYMQKYKQS